MVNTFGFDIFITTYSLRIINVPFSIDVAYHPLCEYFYMYLLLLCMHFAILKLHLLCIKASNVIALYFWWVVFFYFKLCIKGSINAQTERKLFIWEKCRGIKFVRMTWELNHTFVMCVQKFMLTNTHFNDIIILFMGIIMDLNVYTAISVLNAMMWWKSIWRLAWKRYDILYETFKCYLFSFFFST